MLALVIARDCFPRCLKMNSDGWSWWLDCPQLQAQLHQSSGSQQQGKEANYEIKYACHLQTSFAISVESDCGNRKGWLHNDSSVESQKGINTVVKQCSVENQNMSYCHRHCKFVSIAIVHYLVLTLKALWFSMEHQSISDSALPALNWQYM